MKHLTEKIKRMEARQKRLEEALGLELPSAAPSPSPEVDHAESDVQDEGEARYRLTVDEGGNVSDPRIS